MSINQIKEGPKDSQQRLTRQKTTCKKQKMQEKSSPRGYRYKLQSKTQIQKNVLDDYYKLHPSDWERKQIKLISSKINLTVDQVYKYLWHKRNKDRKDICIKIEVKNENEQNVNEQQLEEDENSWEKKPVAMRSITIGEKNILSIPENVLFANQFFIPNKSEVPEFIHVLLSSYANTLTLNVTDE